jgi:iron uptake system component EfeO
MARLSNRQQTWLVIGLSAAVVAAGVGVASLVRPATSASAEDGPLAITVGTDRCGGEWTESTGGVLDFSATNTSIDPLELYLEDPRTHAVYLELEGLGAGATDEVTAVLGDGSYHFVCLPDEGETIIGPTVTIAGAAKRDDLTPAVQPVTSNDLTKPVDDYRAWIEGRLPTLQQDAQQLDSALKADDVAGAKAAWLAGHTEYESLGAAYGAFGDVDGTINGTPAAGLTALTDPDLTGFHRIEALLWSGAAPAEAVPAADQLVTDVASLVADFGAARINPLDIGLRSHEILENAIQFELTGDTDAGSGTSLATIDANLVGTKGAYDPLRDLLSSRGYDLATTDDWIVRSTKLVESFKTADGSWTPIDSLSRSDRQKLDAALSQTVELLAPVAAICDVRKGTS